MANTNGEGTGRSPRYFAVVRRLLFIGLVAYALFTFAPRPAAALSPYDLFLRADTTSVAAGGADFPGQITGHPQVHRPTSLPETDRALLRLDHCSQTPLVLRRDSTTIGRWHTNILSEEHIIPLATARGGSGWTLGVGRKTINDHIWYDFADQDYGLRCSNKQTTAALAYGSESGWRAGAGYKWGKFAATARGARLADILDLPAATTDWPYLQSDAQQYTLGVARGTPEWKWGFQYAWSEPRQTLHVTRSNNYYTAPMRAISRHREGYLAWHGGSETYFATGYDSHSYSAGSILLGLTARGDTKLDTKDSSVAVGWRATQGRRIEQLQLDRRHTSLQTFNQGYAGILPGILANIYALRADADIFTVSLRYGSQHPLSGDWAWLSAIGTHYTKVEGNWRLRSSQGIGRDPRTLSELHISGGRLRLLTLSLGLIYENERSKLVLTYTAGYGEVNDALKTFLRKEKPGEGPSHKLKPNPVVTASLEYRF